MDTYDTFAKQLVPRWVSTNEQAIAGYVALIDRIGPCVLLAHSQVNFKYLNLDKDRD